MEYFEPGFIWTTMTITISTLVYLAIGAIIEKREKILLKVFIILEILILIIFIPTITNFIDMLWFITFIIFGIVIFVRWATLRMEERIEKRIEEKIKEQLIKNEIKSKHTKTIEVS